MTNTSARRITTRSWLVGIVSGMASYIDAAALVTIGTALVIYQDSIGLDAVQIGILSGSVTFCVAAGALVGGRLGDRFGRRSVFLGTMLVVVLGSALLTFGSTFPLLLIGVIVVGFATGADLPVSLATISEYATDKNRGALIGLSSVLWVVGIIAVMAVSAVVGGWGHVGGQILFAHVGVVAILVLLGRLATPESPSWLEANRTQAEDKAPRVGFASLLRGDYREPFIALVLFYTFTNIAANTSGQFNTYVAVNFAGIPVEVVAQIGLITLPVAIVGGLLFMRVADSRWRMLFYVIGGLAFIAAYLVPAVFGFSMFTYVAMGLLSGIGTSLAFEGIMKVWTQESFPTLMRSTAQGSVIAVARVVSALLAFVTPVLLGLGPQLAYGILSGLVAIGLVIGFVAFRGTRTTAFTTEVIKTLTSEETLEPIGSPRN